MNADTYQKAGPVDEFEIIDDQGVLHEVRRLPSGKIVGEFRFNGHIVVEGQEYEVSKCFLVSFKKRKKK